MLFVASLIGAIRRRAIRADLAIKEPGSTDGGCSICANWPFPLEDPPQRRPAYGCLMLVAGYALMVISLLGVLLAGVLVAGLLSAGGTGAIIVVLASPILVLATFKFLKLIGATTQGLRHRAVRYWARDVRSLRQRPGEKPVLLLRSFGDDELEGPGEGRIARRYEERLRAALKRLGPLIAVGRPDEPMGYSGAARLYVSQGNWQNAMRYLMTDCRAVVIIVGRTGGVWWEIDEVLQRAPRDRLLFFFPIVSTFAGGRDHSDAYFDASFLLGERYDRIEAERLERYALFRQRAAPVLGEILPDTLEQAFFLDFLPDGQPRILRSRRSLFGKIERATFPVPRLTRLKFSMSRTLAPFVEKVLRTSDRANGSPS